MDLEKIRTVTVGDVLIDKYIYAEVGGISREAPIPVLTERLVEYKFGGAGNTYKNLSSLSGCPKNHALLGITGVCDDNSREVFLNELNTGYARFVASKTRQNVKTRIMAHQQGRPDRLHARIDSGSKPSNESIDTYKDLVVRFIVDTKPHAIIVSDYGVGSINEGFFIAIGPAAALVDAKIFVDSRTLYKNRHFNDMYAVCPNEEEFCQFLGVGSIEGFSLEKMANEAKRKMRSISAKVMLLKLGKQGNILIRENGEVCINQATRGDAVDTIGAGDSALAGFVLGTLMKDDKHGANLALITGEESVMHTGTHVVSNLLLTGV